MLVISRAAVRQALSQRGIELLSGLIVYELEPQKLERRPQDVCDDPEVVGRRPPEGWRRSQSSHRPPSRALLRDARTMPVPRLWQAPTPTPPASQMLGRLRLLRRFAHRFADPMSLVWWPTSRLRRWRCEPRFPAVLVKIRPRERLLWVCGTSVRALSISGPRAPCIRGVGHC